jgi:hypothetical protein
MDGKKKKNIAICKDSFADLVAYRMDDGNVAVLGHSGILTPSGENSACADCAYFLGYSRTADA